MNMNIKYKKQIIFLLIMMTAVSTILSAQDITEDSLSVDSLSTEDDIINLYFHELNENRLTGSVNTINTEAEFARDSRLSIGSALNGKVPGL
ncbi:MAG: hypothetical protein R3232_11255, partial [Clostridia bacterium]|nr:hypothetical protein [Clostridia bacterium]